MTGDDIFELSERLDRIAVAVERIAMSMLNERLSKLESLGQNCTERYSGTGPGRNIACVLQSGHQGVHTDGTGATW